MEWRFKQLTRNDTLQNAAHLEFFHNEALQSAVDALAREDIQNRLDARGRNEPRVEVRYRLCGPVVAGSHDAWFKGLAPHLESPQTKEELGFQPSLQKPLQSCAMNSTISRRSASALSVIRTCQAILESSPALPRSGAPGPLLRPPCRVPAQLPVPAHPAPVRPPAVPP